MLLERISDYTAEAMEPYIKTNSWPYFRLGSNPEINLKAIELFLISQLRDYEQFFNVVTDHIGGAGTPLNAEARMESEGMLARWSIQLAFLNQADPRSYMGNIIARDFFERERDKYLKATPETAEYYRRAATASRAIVILQTTPAERP